MFRAVFALAFALCLSSAYAETTDGPVTLISGIYKKYQAAGDSPPDIPRSVYSRRLQRLFDADEKATPQGEIGRLSFDVFVNAQDWEIKQVRVAPVTRSIDRAQVRATFRNVTQPEDIMFDFIVDGGRWVIDEVRSVRKGARWTLSKILAGAPDAFPDERR